MRKASREMDSAFAMEVLDKAPYITVSFTRPDGSPYGVPLSLARKDEKTFYYHGALEGDKMDCIAYNPKVRENRSSKNYLSAFPPSTHGCFRCCDRAQSGENGSS